MRRNSIWVVIPAYNEEKYIDKVLKKVSKVTGNVVVVNDGSGDRTEQIVKKNNIICISHKVNLGKGAAMKTGCDYVFTIRHAEAVIFLDSDDQHDVREIELFIKALDQGYDVILGTRTFRSDMPRIRQIGNELSSYLVYWVTGLFVHDVPSGYRAFTRKAYPKIRWEASGYEVETEMIVRMAKHKLSFIEVPIKTIYHDDYKGFSLLDGINILIKLIHWKISL